MANEIIVEEEAAIELAHYLTEIERLGNRSVRDIAGIIQSGVSSQWGTAKIKQFQDEKGVAWVADLTDRFNGEVLFAFIRSGKNGKRHVVKVVGEDDLTKMVPKKPKIQSNHTHLDEMPTMEQQGRDSRNPNGPTLAQQRDQLAQTVKILKEENEHLKKKLIEKQNGTALIRWVDTKQHCEAEIPVNEVSSQIGELIGKGIKTESIVVWSGKKQAKIKVELE